jgi:glycerophosphoryl diester phosphodiesterase
VVIHDFTVDATTDGQGRVAGKTLAELRELDAGSWFDTVPTKRCPEPVEGLAFAGQRIPTLQEVIVEIGHQLLLNIELKVSDSDLVAEVVRLVEDHNLVHRAIVSSLNPLSLCRVKRLNRRISTGLIYHFDLPAHPVRALLLLLTDADALHPEKHLVNWKYMAWAKERGYRVNAWTVDEPAEMKRLIALGVDGIITNRPDVLKKVLGERE